MRAGQSQASPFESKTVVVMGLGRLPVVFAGSQLSTLVGVELEVDIQSESIVETSVTGLPPIGQRIIQEMLVGQQVEDVPVIAEEICRRYVGVARDAVRTALLNGHKHWQERNQPRIKFEDV